MSEMVERMARALHRADSMRPLEDSDTAWEDDSKSQRQRYLRLARDALAAMREPTKAMCDAGWTSGGIAQSWRQMIDEALK